MPDSIIHTPGLPPAGLDRRPIHLTVISCWRCVLLPPIPCAPASPSPFSAASLCSFWILISIYGFPFAVGQEAWSPPLPGNLSHKPFPLQYLDMPLLFRIPPSPPSLYLHHSPRNPIPIRLKAVGYSARSRLYARMYLSWYRFISYQN